MHPSYVDVLKAAAVILVFAFVCFAIASCDSEVYLRMRQ